MDGRVPLVQYQGVGLPSLTDVFDMRRKAYLIRGHSRDLTADEDHVVQKVVCVLYRDDIAARPRKRFLARNLAEGKDVSGRRLHAAADEHPVVHVHRHGATAIRRANEAERHFYAADMVPMPMREDDGLDRRKIQPQAICISLQGRTFRPGVEEKAAADLAAPDGNHKRQAEMRAAKAVPRKLAGSGLNDVLHFCCYRIRNGRENVGDVVDKNQNIATVYRMYGHRIALPADQAEVVDRRHGR